MMLSMIRKSYGCPINAGSPVSITIFNAIDRYGRSSSHLADLCMVQAHFPCRQQRVLDERAKKRSGTNYHRAANSEDRILGST
jgi:hypothetical protein